MKKADIGLAPLPQVDGQIKHRPVVLLCRMPPFGDFLVCGISTQLHQHVAGFDEKILSTDPDFPATGLKASSILRLGFLAILLESVVLGRIGSLSSERHQRLLTNPSHHLASEGQSAPER